MARHHRRHRRHHRYGRDALTGGGKHSWLAKAAGFLLVPTVTGMATGAMVKSMPAKNAAMAFTGAHAAALALSWWGAKKFPSAHSFLRGAMWGEAIVTPISAYETTQIPAPGIIKAAPTGSQAQLDALAQKLMSGSLFFKS
jgi:hypothetical protein